jgi:hypothetical protein
MRVSVSDLDSYRAFREDEDFPLEVLLAQFRRETPATPAMMIGRAFAKAMEHAQLGEADTLTAEGHTFAFTCDVEIEAWPCREESRDKDYGGVIVTARCDRIMGKVIADDKTTAHFDAESYMEKYQWRYYLDLFGADVFRWHIWECKKLKEDNAWCVYDRHILTQYRYPELEQDCRELALDFKQFAERIGWQGRQFHSSHK